MKILLTGAHFTPAKAVIDQLKRKPDIELTYVGRRTTLEGDQTPSVESAEIPKLGVKYRTIVAGRMRRTFDFLTLISLMKIPLGFLQSLYIIWSEKPHVVLSFGGYVGLPISFAAWLFSIPLIIHEQGLSLGLANKICAPLASKIAYSFNLKRSLRTKEVITGNPLREEVLKPVKTGEEFQGIFRQSIRTKLPVILVMGGNQGSHALNVLLESCLESLLKVGCVIHQTGDSRFADFARLKQKQQAGYLVTRWIHQDIGKVYEQADLCICRAGVNTLMELAYFGIPALMVPIPGHSEQNINAKYFEKIGLGKILVQSDLNSANFCKLLKKTLNNLAGLQKQAKSAKSQIIVDGAKRLALETVLLGKIS